MARLLGPDMGSRAAFLPTGAPAAGKAGTVYADPAGTTPADIAAYQPGNPGTPGLVISGSVVVLDDYGLLPLIWFPPGLVDRVWISVNGGPLVPIDADNNARADAALGPTVRIFGALGDGTTDDAPAIQAALDAAAPGSTVYLPPGRYAVASPLSVPPFVTLQGMHGNRTDSIHTASVLTPLPSFTGTAVIRLLDQEEGGYATDTEGVRLVTVTIDGASAPAGLHGIQASGRVHGTVLDRVAVQNIPGTAVTTKSYTRADSSVKHPFSWNLWQCLANGVGGDGFELLSVTDSTLLNCHALGVGGQGFILSSLTNTQLVGCRAEWSSSNGFRVTGNWLTGQGAGGLLMADCSTDRNSGHGVLIDATGSGQININGPMLRRDGRNGYPGAGGGSFAALRVSASTMPVLVNGITVYPGLGDDGAGVNSPQYGVSATGSTAVIVASGYLHADSLPWHDGGGNTVLHRGLAVFGATGSTSSPTRETATHLDVTGRALGAAQARDFGLVAQTYDSNSAVSGQVTTGGTVYLMAVYVPRPVTVSSIVWYVHGVAVTPTAGQNEIGLYNSAGTKLASANVDSAITSVNVKTTTITSTALVPGLYWIGFVFNAATPPTLARGGDLNAGLINANLGAASYRAATNGTGATALPSTITPGSNTAYQRLFWCAIK